MRDNTEMNTSIIMFEELPVNWKWMLVIGIFMVIAGALGVAYSFYVTIVSIILFGSILATSGVIQLIDAIKSKEEKWQGQLQHFLIAILYLAAAVLVIWDPISASVAVTAMLAGIFIVIGVIRIGTAIQNRRQKWRWVLPLFAGLVTLVLAFGVLFTLPASGLWLIGLLISVDILMNGWILTLISLRVKNSME